MPPGPVSQPCLGLPQSLHGRPSETGMIVTQAIWSNQMGMSMIAKRLYCQPSQMGMLTIATQSVQPDAHAYDCHTGCIVGPTRWAYLRLPHGRSSQMGIPKIATQATLSAQPDGHAYDCHTVSPARCACL